MVFSGYDYFMSIRFNLCKKHKVPQWFFWHQFFSCEKNLIPQIPYLLY